MGDTISTILKGAVIGVANIIPGVSGGTMALVLGFYDRLIQAISRLTSSKTITDMKASFKKDEDLSFGDFLRRYDIPFLALLGIGAAVAIVGLSKLLGYLLETQYVPTYGFFFGLVAASILVPWQLLKRRSWRELVAALLAAGLTITLANLQSADERLEAAQQKYALEQTKEAGATGQVVDGAEEKKAASADVKQLAWFFFVGAIAISAMILPGVSGSFLLLLFGVYFDVINAINERDVMLLGVFALGCGIGIGLFTKLLNFLLARYYSPTMAFLAGLMVGSLSSLWPFKTVEYVGSRPVPLGNIWPQGFGSVEWLTAGTILAGAVIVIGFVMYDNKRSQSESTEAK